MAGAGSDDPGQRQHPGPGQSGISTDQCADAGSCVPVVTGDGLGFFRFPFLVLPAAGFVGCAVESRLRADPAAGPVADTRGNGGCPAAGYLADLGPGQSHQSAGLWLVTAYGRLSGLLA